MRYFYQAIIFSFFCLSNKAVQHCYEMPSAGTMRSIFLQNNMDVSLQKLEQLAYTQINEYECIDSLTWQVYGVQSWDLLPRQEHKMYCIAQAIIQRSRKLF